MIDDSDGDFFGILSLFSKGWPAVIFIIIALIFYLIAASNESECRQRACPAGSTAKLLDHECVCVSTPR